MKKFCAAALCGGGIVLGLLTAAYAEEAAGAATEPQVEQPAATRVNLTAEQAANARTRPATMTLKECGALYRAAKEADQLAGLRWMDFRVDRCGYGDKSAGGAPVSAGSHSASAVAPKAPPASLKPIPAGVTFPDRIAAEFAAETPAKQRMHTCLQGYHSNKQAGTLSGVRWIEAGGGYYSACNKRLKEQL